LDCLIKSVLLNGLISVGNIGIELTDKFAQHHHHLSCLNCHRVIPINKDELENFMTQLALAQQFTPVEHQVEIQGYCSYCSKSAA